MKGKFILLYYLVLITFMASAQQMPNGGFETWTNSFSPVSWVGIEDIVHLPSSIFTFQDSTDFYEGHNSLKLVSDSFAAQPARGVLSGVISLGTAVLGNSISFHGIPFPHRPDSIFFAYKYSSPGNDTAVMILSMTQGGVNQVLGGQLFLTPSALWSVAAIPLASFYHIPAVLPDTLVLQFMSSHKAPVKGSTFHLDGLRFGYIPSPPLLSAHIFTASGQSYFCAGDSLKLLTDTGVNYTYQWALDSVQISGATASTFEAKLAGYYNVFIDRAGTHSISPPVYVSDSACITGMNYIASTSLKIYPNPAKNLLNISASAILDGCRLQIFDMPGKPVWNQVLDGNHVEIDISKLAAGLYFYNLTGKDGAVLKKDLLDIIK